MACPTLSHPSSDWWAIWRCLSQHSHCYNSCIQIGKLFGDAYLSTATAKTAVNEFKKTGISPFNPSDWLAIWRCLFKGSHHYYSHLKKTYSVMQTSLARIKSGLKINVARWPESTNISLGPLIPPVVVARWSTKILPKKVINTLKM